MFLSLTEATDLYDPALFPRVNRSVSIVLSGDFLLRRAVQCMFH